MTAPVNDLDTAKRATAEAMQAVWKLIDHNPEQADAEALADAVEYLRLALAALADVGT